MPRLLRIAGIVVAALLSAAGASYLVALAALVQPQPFYERALAADATELAAAKAQLEARVARLAAESRPAATWTAEFTADEVNGWLAAALAGEEAPLLPPSVTDVRVAFTPGGCLLGFRYTAPRLAAIVSIEVEATIGAPNLATLRLVRAHAGAIALPASYVRSHANSLLTELDVVGAWREAPDRLELDVPLDRLVDACGGERRQLTSLSLGEGTMQIAGRLGDEPAPQTAAAPRRPRR
ncbi:MAG: hypothetical protein KF847_04755 [Pirellulales bacterium]|nr:hypothetical protein [Pirellulales bacterium]